jgi:sulfide:quinone oxidoreductase
MDEKKIAPDYAVSGQITPAEVKEVRARGYRSIMCNRPDDEQPGQPRFAEIEAAAREVGLAVAWVPVVSGQITDADVEAFRAKLDELPHPVFAYCRSGGRSQNLWVLAQS